MSRSRGVSRPVGPATDQPADHAPAALEPARRERTKPKPAEPKRAEPKRAGSKQAEPKRAEPKRAEPRRAGPKRAQPDPVSPAADEATDMVRLTDPRAIRALAHPARLAVLDALNDVDKTMTATQAAQLTGLSPSAMSYHLRALAKWGIVRVADAAADADGRERRWRRGGAGLFMETMPAGTESATAMIAGRAFDRIRDTTMRFLQRSSRESEFWRETAMISHSDVWITEAEAAELNNAILEITERFRRQRRTSRTHPDDARLVHASFVIVPVDEPAPADGGSAGSQ